MNYGIPTEEAFDRSGLYEWQGQPIGWSERHHYLWHWIIYGSNFFPHQQCLLVMWVGLHTDTESIKDVERMMRKDPDIIYDELHEFFPLYPVGGEECLAAMKLTSEIFEDEDASNNELDEADGEGSGGSPGKSPAVPDTSSTSMPLPVSHPMRSATSSPTHKGNSSSPSSSAASVTNSSETSRPASGSRTSPDSDNG